MSVAGGPCRLSWSTASVKKATSLGCFTTGRVGTGTVSCTGLGGAAYAGMRHRAPVLQSVSSAFANARESGDKCYDNGESSASHVSEPGSVCGGHNSALGAVAIRACVEEEVFQRRRIHLAQLESWKELRVIALREQPACRCGGSRSASQRAMSAATPEKSTSFPSPQPQGQHRHLLGKALPVHLLDEWWAPDLECNGEEPLKECEGGKAPSDAQGGTSLQEEELVVMKCQLEGANENEAKALLEVRAATERTEELEAQLRSTQQALAGASEVGRETQEELMLRDRQVEALSMEAERLRTEREVAAADSAKTGTLLEDRAKELESIVEACGKTEFLLAKRLQDTQRELRDLRQMQMEEEETFCSKLQEQRLAEERAEEVERQLQEAVRSTEEERQAEQRVVRSQAQALQRSQTACEELQRCYKKKAQRITDGVARYKAIVTALDASGASSTAQLKGGMERERYRCEELEQLLARERSTTATSSAALQDEMSSLRYVLKTLQGEELLCRVEARFASLAASRRCLQEELERGRQAEALLREASLETVSLHAAVTGVLETRCAGASESPVSPVREGQSFPRSKNQNLKQRQRRGLSLRHDNAPPQGGVMSLPLGRHVSGSKGDECVARNGSRCRCAKTRVRQHQKQFAHEEDAKDEGRAECGVWSHKSDSCRCSLSDMFGEAVVGHFDVGRR